MRLFFSVEEYRRAAERFVLKFTDDEQAAMLLVEEFWRASGYGRHFYALAEACKRLGIDVVMHLDEAEGCDCEVVFGAPFEFIRPFSQPAIKCTMVEWFVLPNEFAQYDWSIWEFVFTPSKWSKEQLRIAGVTCPIFVIPNGIWPEEVPYLERDWYSDELNILAMSVSLADRKMQIEVLEHLLMHDIPSHWRVTFKTAIVESTERVEMDVRLNANIRMIRKTMPWDELLQLLAEHHISINLSSGEGFGLLPLEHAATGMNVLIHSHSGFSQFVRKDLFWTVEAYPRFITRLARNAYWADFDGALGLLKYCDNRREILAAISKPLSDYVHSNFTWLHSAERLIDLIERYVLARKGKGIYKPQSRTLEELMPTQGIKNILRRVDTLKSRRDNERKFAC